jgi:hypothetical protein
VPGLGETQLVTPPTERNNVLFYVGLPDDVVVVDSPESANGVFSRFDVVVLAQPNFAVPAEVTALETAIRMYRTSKRLQAKVFARLAWVDLATFQAAIASWLAQPNLAGQLTGFYITGFGVATRADQNTAVDLLHTNKFSAMVDPGSTKTLFDILGVNDGEVDPTLGRLTTIRDYVMVVGLGTLDTNVASPVTEALEAQIGRLEYAIGATYTGVTATSRHNLGVLAVMGAGTATVLNEADWLATLTRAKAYGLEGFGVAPFDRGLAGLYFEDWRSTPFQP